MSVGSSVAVPAAAITATKTTAATATITVAVAATATATTTEATATAAAATEATTTRAVFLGAGLIDNEGTATEIGAVHRLGRLGGVLGVSISDKGKAARAAGHFVKSDKDIGQFAELGEGVAKLFLRGFEGHVTHVKFGTTHDVIYTSSSIVCLQSVPDHRVSNHHQSLTQTTIHQFLCLTLITNERCRAEPGCFQKQPQSPGRAALLHGCNTLSAAGALRELDLKQNTAIRRDRSHSPADSPRGHAVKTGMKAQPESRFPA
jgi:hypothetical protein